MTHERVLAILASGSGSNFEALVHAERRGILGGRIAALLCDRPEAQAIERARRLGVAVESPPAGRHRTKLDDEAPWLEALARHGAEVVLLAGFMRRLHAPFLRAYPDRILNLHPSLLPAFPGLGAIEQAWRAGVRVTGCTVHLVNEALDAGAILAQEAVPVLDGDTPQSLAARIRESEHRLYPATVRRFLTTPWRRDGARVVWEPA